ncbi:MAG TPA: alpha/beta hydrolase, partial [Nevskiaceae bacterium]|nr:alpha/beta hydrolase [Nevskiaceae bacterium]
TGETSMLRLLKWLLILAAVVFGGVLAYLHLDPVDATARAVALQRQAGGLVRREITLPDGTLYVYLEGGQGRPLVLLHGFGANKDNWTRVARYLTPRYHVIAPDHVGFGESAHPQDADYAPPAQAERLHQLAAALNLGKVDVGGSSMGGHIAMTWAAKYPDEVQSLWLLDPGGVWSAPKSELATIIDAGGENPLMARTTDEYAAIFRFVMARPPFIPRPILDQFAKERIANYTLEQRIFKQIREDDVEDRVKGLATPTLIVFGDQDRAINPAAAGVLQPLLPKSQVIIMKGLGHLPMIEDPKQSADDYLAFRAGIGG